MTHHNLHLKQSNEQQHTLRYRSRFMNERAVNKPYVPTVHEHVANCLTHGFLVIPACIAAQVLISNSVTSVQYWSSIIYGSALIMLFSFSTVFHCSCFYPGLRLLIRTTKSVTATCTISIVWSMAVLGILYQMVYHERYKWLETCFYVSVGVLPAVVIMDIEDRGGILELAYGGLVFLLGIIFFKADGLIPFAHAIWHCFVFFGASIHYYAIYSYLLSPLNNTNANDDETINDIIKESIS
ncbi:unnamed protein product [Didymodactylos carnosus]|uniref:Uncharacterized protein n=1 Tax=Didymodactylos carnosus TaxID=1234261 RepID=A0A813Q4Z9_9BILA|nr:unnamed protein product [Didymodactylos carnosus]CAF0938912.1 unnamed protein product [Didymodactylos carnosus]CAF3543079.1 unnamed protein product [Didymodactylos carnosus]CAF3714307.1 unnamed protein product [Didymodactylos carnosus]